MKKQQLQHLINMSLNSQVMTLFAFAFLMAMGNSLMAQNIHPEDETQRATFDWNIGKGNVEFYMSSGTLKYSGYKSDGTQQTGDHDPSNIYNISGSASSSLSGGDKAVIKIGTPSAAVNQDIVIYLDGTYIYAPHKDNSNHAAPIYVNNSAGTVYLVLKDRTTTTLKGYGQSDHMANGTATSYSYAHSAIEKEMNSNGTLVITCETGYTNYKNNNNTGHTCTAGGSCGDLVAIASGATYRGSASGGNLSIFCGAAIGAAGRKTGTLKNLVIAGGEIDAQVMWDNMNNGIPSALDGEDKSSYAPGIGVGAAANASSSTPAGNIKITGGYIKSQAGNGSPACIGGGYRSGNITVDIYGGNITATERVYTTSVKYRGAGIGAGGGGDSSGAAGTGTVNIYGGTITASSQYGAAIGGSAGGTSGGAQPATVSISGGTITANTTTGEGAAIGSGGSTGNGSAAQATVTISGGTINARSRKGADIGGGGTDGTGTDNYGGKGIVTISGGTITTTGGGIGGGKANAGAGGDADVTVTGGTISTTSIGGGDSNSNKGGDASIYITGGSLTCKKFIGGGNSDTGTPGSVSSSVSGRAGVHITGSNKITLKAGYIGGGANTAGNVGKATVYINATHAQSTIQGQFILSNTSSTAADHCYFTMEAGTIDNTNLGDVGVSLYPRKKADGGAVYMTDNYGVVRISGGTIKNCTAPNGHGGAVFMDKTSGTFNGSFTLSGDAVIESCQATGSVADGGTGRGGAVFMSDGSFTMSGGQIRKCTAQNRGGAVYQSGGTMTISGGTIGGNSLSEGNKGLHGGGVYSRASFTMSGGNVKYNQTTDAAGDGGGLCISSGADVVIKGGTIEGNQSNDRGGGLYLNPGGSRTTYINSKASTTTITSNTAKRGAGAFVNSGTLNINSTATTISDNIASNLGGGFYVNGGTVNDTASIIIGNTAANDGGGIYSAGGTVNLISARVNDNTATSGNGGGVYATSPVNVKGATISGNKAENGTNGLGGGIYANSAGNDITIESSSTINNNLARNGGGLYAAAGTVYVKTNATMTGNGASGDGGAIYANGGTVNVSASSTSTKILKENYANNGGAIYANGGTVNFSNGIIEGNYAHHNGGALYIPATGTLYLKGTATLTKNHVPLGCHGGGVYLLGTVQAGSTSKANDVIKVEDNYADAAGATVTASNRNNIYLPDPKDTQTKDVITIVNGGLNLSSSKVGFSVPGNFVPVIYCSDYNYLNTNQTAIINAVFEDSERYTAQYFYNTSPYKKTYIYLVADTWVEKFKTIPSGFSLDNINTPEKLAWLITVVNGRNDVSPAISPNNLSGQTVKITADIDMSRYGWVPIGKSGTPFKGTLDGGGHVVSGIYCSYLTGTNYGTGTGLGMFGTVENAEIHDLFIKDEQVLVKNQETGTYSLGGLANEVKGTSSIYNCTVEAKMECSLSTTPMGGIAASIASGSTVHSSAAMPEMMGYQMGGIACTNAGNIYNSFANPSFTHSGSGTEYVGGLVAVNTGLIKNSYVRLERDMSLGSAHFGMLAGSNTGTNTIVWCYAPDKTAFSHSHNYLYSGTTGLSECGYYGRVVAPYLYAHSTSTDNAVSGTPLLTLLNLNREGRAKWKRTTAGAYSEDAGNINGDYPIHKLVSNGANTYTCAASTDGIDLDYAYSLDAMLSRHVANATVNLYANDANVTGSTGEGVVVYIDENTSLLQDVGSDTPSSNIQAYTCQTIPGTPRSWHYISSSLSNSTIGFNYSNDATFNWSADPCGLTFSSDDDHALFPSDMPAVESMDLYCFYEPEYHWINFKRNSNSHWHMNATNLPINYANETELQPGKGYLVSIDQDQLLQNRGTLNNGDVTATLNYTLDNAWAGLLGYNLIGNPYQSYLSFSRFAMDNNGIWAERGVEPTYAVYDDAMGGYIQYKEGSSRGARAASGTINMHQGFLVRTASATTMTFTNNMRTNDGSGVTFREEQPAYPLINLKVTDDEGVNDFAVLELGREADAGAEKLRVNDSKGWIYLRNNGENYGILFRSEVDYQPMCFEASEAGNYTLSWETANGEFEELTLIDNITGTMTDMLARDSYVFEADPEQFVSRFKIRIGDWKDIEENNEDGLSTGSGTFAFMNNGTLVVNGEGKLEIVDMLGRVIEVKELHGSQSMVPMPHGASGMYVLQLTSDGATKVQKIVVK